MSEPIMTVWGPTPAWVIGLIFLAAVLIVVGVFIWEERFYSGARWAIKETHKCRNRSTPSKEDA